MAVWYCRGVRAVSGPDAAGRISCRRILRLAGHAIQPAIVCTVLCVIGLKMLWDVRKGEDSGDCFTLSKKTVLVQAVATSMDALAVGVGFSTMQLPIPATCGLIALTTFLICLAGWRSATGSAACSAGRQCF